MSILAQRIAYKRKPEGEKRKKEGAVRGPKKEDNKKFPTFLATKPYPGEDAKSHEKHVTMLKQAYRSKKPSNQKVF